MFGGTGGNFAGTVFDKRYIAPALRTMQGGFSSQWSSLSKRKKMMHENKERRIGNIFGATGGNHAGMVFDKDYLAPALNAMEGGLRQPMIVIEDKDYYCCASSGFISQIIIEIENEKDNKE